MSPERPDARTGRPVPRSGSPPSEAEIGKVIVGQPDIVRGVLTGLFVGGHVLLEGVPGLGKTLLVRTLAQVLDLKFNRVQFTPDLMPSDIIGTNIISETPDGQPRVPLPGRPAVRPDRAGRRDQPGHAQDAVGPAGGDAGAQRHRRRHHPQLEEPFFVLATQNPIEQEGTYPLPEAQLDRFFFKLLVPFTTREEMTGILDRTTRNENPQAEQGDGRRRDPAVAAARRARCWWPRRCRTTPSGWCWPRTPAASSRRPTPAGSSGPGPAPAGPRR